LHSSFAVVTKRRAPSRLASRSHGWCMQHAGQPSSVSQVRNAGLFFAYQSPVGVTAPSIGWLNLSQLHSLQGEGCGTLLGCTTLFAALLATPKQAQAMPTPYRHANQLCCCYWKFMGSQLYCIFSLFPQIGRHIYDLQAVHPEEGQISVAHVLSCSHQHCKVQTSAS